MGVQAATGVTLCAVTSVGLEATVAAMRHSLEQLRFEHAVLLSHVRPAGLDQAEIEWRPIHRLNSRSEYSRFMLHDLADHIATPHVLVVQWDGFIRSGGQWCEKFLACDYVGAVWPQFDDEMRVGNGGFSLRSRRLLEATRNIAAGPEAEDLSICRTHRHMLERKYGIRFADLETARRFSYERERSTGDEFGFHGAYNLLAELPLERAVPLFQSLEPGVLGARESVELMFDALGEFNWDLARMALKHVQAHPHVLRRVYRGLRTAIRNRSTLP